MTLSELAAHVETLQRKYGDAPVVLWDLDTGWYFQLGAVNFEAQRMKDGSVRVSVGPNSYGDYHADHPAERPLP
ncbi:MAG TPA: hypothetical protein VN680_06325 [Burkholderiaceae bacterium]|nr:hypothetical protein [Burkholderiaceae bacterium]